MISPLFAIGQKPIGIITEKPKQEFGCMAATGMRYARAQQVRDDYSNNLKREIND